LSSVSSNDVRKRISDQVSFWLTKQDNISAEELTKLSTRLEGVKLTTTTGSENPNYVLFWTNEKLLSLIA